MTTGRNVEAAHPTKRGVTAAYISETTGGWATATVTTPSRSSRLARQPLSPYHEQTEERSDRTRHENGERDRVTATGHSDPLASKLKLLPRPVAGNSRNRSRQSDLGVAASGQETATGHPETTRVNAVRPLAVQRPPRPHSDRARQNSNRDDPRPQCRRTLSRERKAE